jgi:hypothetical protein
VCNDEQPDAALDTLLIPVTNKEKEKQMTVKTVKSLWIDEEFKNGMIEKDETTDMAYRSGCTFD